MNTLSPLVSIIVPCFNAERFLPETLDSIFAQTYKNYEIILIDDASTDSTPEIIQSLKDRVRFRLETKNEGGGGGGAREKGLKIAKGEYIQYVDSDDILFPEAIEKRVEMLEAQKGDIAYSDFQCIEEMEGGEFQPTAIKTKTIEETSSDTQLALFDRWWRPLVSLTFHRQIVERISWRKTFIDDARYVFDACLAGARFVHVPGVQAHYRIHKKGISRDQTSWYQGILEYAVYVENIWKNSESLSEGRRDAMIAYYKKIAGFSRGKDARLFNEAFQHLLGLKTNNLMLQKIAESIGFKNTDAIIRIAKKLRNLL